MHLICRHDRALMSVLMFTLKLTRRRFSHLAFDPPEGQTYHDMLSLLAKMVSMFLMVP